MTLSILCNGLGATSIEASKEVLQTSGCPLDAVQQGLSIVEADPNIPYVGIGAEPNMLGVLETDAAIMNGSTREVGAVGALQGYLSAISVARAVMTQLPHVLLVGAGAARFAKEIDARVLPEPGDQDTHKHQQFLKQRIPQNQLNHFPDIPLAPFSWPQKDDDPKKDTVIFLARTDNGHCVAASSTSGWGYKYPGRLGDSPLVGAGLYADSRFGACACTHTGEMTVRCSTARSVILAMKYGASVQDAVYDAMEDLHQLQNGYLGPVVIHAFDKNGEPFVLSAGDAGARYWTINEHDTHASEHTPVFYS